MRYAIKTLLLAFAAALACAPAWAAYGGSAFVSTPTYPVNGSHTVPYSNFTWMGPSTSTVAGLDPAARYVLQVSMDDPGFSPAGMVISIATGTVVFSTHPNATDGMYPSTFTLAAGGTYYWRVCISSDGVYAGWSRTFSFTIDDVDPVGSGFRSLDSGGAEVPEDSWTDKNLDLSLRYTVQDERSGLLVSTWTVPDHYRYPPGSVGALVSTTAGASFSAGTWSQAYANANMSGVLSMAVYKNKLYTGTGVTGRIYSFDGTTWVESYDAVPLHIYALQVYEEKLYAACSGNTILVYDGFTWETMANPPDKVISVLAVHNGKLYAGESGDGAVWVYDGISWARLYDTGYTRVDAMISYNGRLYVGAGTGGYVLIFDGYKWTMVDQAGAYCFGMAVYDGKLYRAVDDLVYVYSDNTGWGASPYTLPYDHRSIAVFNGLLFVGTYSGVGARIFAFDGTTWHPVNTWTTSPSMIQAMLPYKGKLYAGPNLGRVYVLDPFAASVGGTDGTLAAQTLSVTGLALANSTNTTQCSGASTCGASNQVVLSVTDMAGNVHLSGRWAVRVDTSMAVTVSTPGFPADGSFVNLQPNFSWAGPSTSTLAGIAGPSYLLQVSDGDPAFPSNKIAVQISTPAIIASTMSAGTDGVYISTYTLLPGTTYYWRVRLRSSAGSLSRWSRVSSFVLDTVKPESDGSSFRSLSSTGGWLGESQWNDLPSGASARVAARDAASGLLLSTGAPADNQPFPSGGFGVLASTSAGNSWLPLSRTVSHDGTAEEVVAFVRFNGRLYAATSGTSNGEGTILLLGLGGTWSVVYNSPYTSVLSFAEYGGRLYAGQGDGADSGDVLVCNPASSGDPAVCEAGDWSTSLDTSYMMIYSLAVYNGKLYAGTGGGVAGRGDVLVYDGISWSTAWDGPQHGVRALAVYNGRLYAALSQTSGDVYAYDGTGWTKVYDSDQSYAFALAVYDGKLYVGLGSTFGAADIAVYTGAGAWSLSYDAPYYEYDLRSFAVFNGLLYASQRHGGDAGGILVFDGTSWQRAYTSSQEILHGLVAHDGKLYAGQGSGSGDGDILAFTPAGTASLSGADGTTASETLTVSALQLAASTSAATCELHHSDCSATNQLKFFVTDRAGNVKVSGPYAVLADTLTAQAFLRTDLPADGSFVNLQPGFSWSGPSTGTLGGMGSGAAYHIQVANNDPAFGAGNLAVSITTPAYVSAPLVPQAAGAYVSTYTLLSGTTYYWRVRLLNGAGIPGPWSGTSSFVLDLQPPELVLPLSSAFESQAAGGSWLSETGWNDRRLSVSARLSARDTASGLLLSTATVPDTQPAPPGGFGVVYSTNAASSWIDGSWTQAYDPAEDGVMALAAFRDRIFAGASANGRTYYSTDGTAWFPSAPLASDDIRCFAVHGSTLFAGGTGNGNARVFAFDGSDWTLSTQTVSARILSLASFGGRLFAGTDAPARVLVYDGSSWGTAYSVPVSSVAALAAHNGRLFAATSGGVYVSTSGASWSKALDGDGASRALAVYNGKLYAASAANIWVLDGGLWSRAAQTGETAVLSLTVFAGRLYAGTEGAGRVWMFDGVNWSPVYDPPEGSVAALAAFNGRLYAGGGSPPGAIYGLAPVGASVPAEDGTTSAQALSATGLDLANSTSTAYCSGSYPCGATNQVRINFTDRAGNVRAVGPFAVLADAVSAVALSNPGFPPAGSVLGYQPNLSWSGPSTSVVSALGAAPLYYVQVSSADPAFAPANIVVSVSTPAVVASTTAAGTDGVYLSTYTLAAGATYYWRVRLRAGMGNYSPWSSTSSFSLDFAQPEASAFATSNSTGGWVNESQWNDKVSGVDARLIVRDVPSGLLNSTSTRPGDLRLAPGSWSLSYSTSAGQSWISGAWTDANDLAGTYIFAMAVHDGRLYGGTGGNSLMFSFDGTSWSQVADLDGEGFASMAVYDGRLYAGTYRGGKLYVRDNGTGLWSVAVDVSAFDGETTLSSLAVYNGRLYAGGGTLAKVYVWDGSTWSVAFDAPGSAIQALAVYNGRLYAAADARVYIYDGAAWTSGAGSPASLYCLAVYDGRLFAGGFSQAFSFDGTSWTSYPNLPGRSWPYIYALAVFGGRLFSGNGLGYIDVYDGVSWTQVDQTEAVRSLAAFNGRLYAGTSQPLGLVRQFTPLSGTLSGTEGSTSLQTLTVSGLDLATSTNVVVCGGGSSCGATNQVRLNVTDLAGKVRAAGPYSVLVDNVSGVAVSTPGHPADGSYIGRQPNFSWAGPSTATLGGLVGNADYQVQVSSADPAFAPGNIVVSVSTPVVIQSTTAAVTDGVYVSTYTLSAGATYYWRVRLRTAAGNLGPWSRTSSFVMDLSPPSVSGFSASNSTGGWYNETQWVDQAAGVSARVSARDSFPGLLKSTATKPGQALSAPGGYAVSYSSTAGASWVDGSWSLAYASPDSTIWSMAVFQDKLYAGTWGNGLVHVYDGSSWTTPYDLADSAVLALAAFDGRLWAGTNVGNIYVLDGGSWVLSYDSPASWITGFEVFNGRLYACARTPGEVYVYDGRSWSLSFRSPETGVNALQAYNGKLYAGTSSNGYIYAYDGTRWTLAQDSPSAEVVSFALYGQSLYAGTSGGFSRLHILDGDTWSYVSLPENNRALAAFNGSLAVGSAGTPAQIALFDGSTLRASTRTSVTEVHALAQYRGKLFAGGVIPGHILALDPLSASLSGAEGSTAEEVLSSSGLSLGQSASAANCSGGASCGATNQVRFAATDLAGRVRATGPYSILVDTSVPAPAMTSLSALDEGLLATASGSDPLSGLKDYNFEASSSAAFAWSVSSSGFRTSPSFTFAGLLTGTTYYVRATARDNAFNLSAPSVALATMTVGSVRVSTSDAAGASIVQDGLAAFLRFALVSEVAGASATFRSVRVSRLGACADADIADVRVYEDTLADGIFSQDNDTLRGSGFLSDGQAVVNLSSDLLVSDSPRTFFLAAKAHRQATAGLSVGLRLGTAADMNVLHPFHAVGPFPSDSGLSLIQDLPSTITVSGLNTAPAVLQPGLSDVSMLRLNLSANAGGAALLSGAVVYLAGSMPPNKITAVKFLKDSNATGALDAGDAQVSDTGLFSAAGVSTLTFTAAPAARKVLDAPETRLFLAVSLSADAPEGSTFSVRIATPSEFRLAGSSDAVVFTAVPLASDPAMMQINNVLTVRFASEIPAELSQGASYAVIRASLTVNAGAAQINRLRLSHVGYDHNVSSVKAYRDAVVDGGTLNLVDDGPALGGASLVSGAADIPISTVTVTAGATTVLFLAYDISPSASPGETIGAAMTNASFIEPVSAFTTVTGDFPFQTSLGTVAATVNTLSVTPVSQAPGSLFQGATSQALLRLSMVSSPYAMTLSGLTVQSLGTAADSDVSALKFYRDENGDGVLQTSTDTLLVSRAPSGGSAFLDFGTPLAISSSAAAYFIAVDVAPAAVADRTFGVSVLSTASFIVSAPNRVSTGPPVFPFTAGPVTLREYADTVSVSTRSLVPSGGAEPGALNVPLVELTLRTDVADADWLTLKLDRTGTAGDSALSALKLYYDQNDLGTFDTGRLGDYLLVTSSTMTFGSQGSAGTVTLDLRQSRTLLTTPRRYFLVADLSASASPDTSLTVRAVDATYFGLRSPNIMAPTSFAAGPLEVISPPRRLYLAAYSSAPASAVQGASNLPMLSMALWMEQYSGRVSGLTVQRSTDSTGGDADVSRVKLYIDDGNGAFDPALDTQLATGAFSGGSLHLSFSQRTVTTSTQTWFLVFDLSSVAGAGGSVGATVGVPSAFVIASPHSVASSGFPLRSGNILIRPTQNGVFVTAQDRAPASLPQGATGQVLLSLTLNTTSNAVLLSALTVDPLGTAAASDIARLRIFLDEDLDGVLDPTDTQIASLADPFSAGRAALALSPAPTLTSSAKRLLVAADIAGFAVHGRTFGIRVSSASSFSLPAPNYVMDAGFPMDSSLPSLVKLAESLVVTPVSELGSGVIQGSTFTAVRLSAVATRDRLAWTRWKVRKDGTLGDAGVASVGLYRDMDGDLAWSAADLLIGSGTFTAGSVTVDLSSAQTITTSTQTYFIRLAVAADATIGATLGVLLQDAGHFTVSFPDGVSGQNLPFQTGQVPVLDARTPSQPVVTLPDGTASKSFESLRFSWASAVLLGSIASAEYAIGTTPGGQQTRAFTAMPASPGEVAAAGLFLAAGATYYVSVRATSSFGFTSPVGTGLGQLIDYQTPGKPSVSAVVGQNSIVLDWPASAAGPSGVRGYLVEYRKADSPLWLNARTHRASAASIPAGAARAADMAAPAAVPAGELASPPFNATGLPSGTLFFRVRAVSNSDVVGDPSEELKTQFGPLPRDAISKVSSYPNPFDSRKRSAMIAYDLPAAVEVKIQIFDLFGAKVREMSFPAGSMGGLAGTNTVPWDGSDESGRKVSMGAYLCVIRSGGSKVIHKIGVIH